MSHLIQKLKNKTTFVVIIGLEYVELPLAIAFSKKFNTVWYDVYDKCIANILSGKSHILDVFDIALQTHLGKSFFPTKNHENLKKCDFSDIYFLNLSQNQFYSKSVKEIQNYFS